LKSEFNTESNHDDQSNSKSASRRTYVASRNRKFSGTTVFVGLSVDKNAGVSGTRIQQKRLAHVASVGRDRVEKGQQEQVTMFIRATS
jgi:hypothetical protein